MLERIFTYAVSVISGLSVAEPKYFKPAAFATLLRPGPVAAPMVAVPVGVPLPVGGVDVTGLEVGEVGGGVTTVVLDGGGGAALPGRH